MIFYSSCLIWRLADWFWASEEDWPFLSSSWFSSSISISSTISYLYLFDAATGLWPLNAYRCVSNCISTSTWSTDVYSFDSPSLPFKSRLGYSCDLYIRRAACGLISGIEFAFFKSSADGFFLWALMSEPPKSLDTCTWLLKLTRLPTLFSLIVLLRYSLSRDLALLSSN